MLKELEGYLVQSRSNLKINFLHEFVVIRCVKLLITILAVNDELMIFDILNIFYLNDCLKC